MPPSVPRSCIPWAGSHKKAWIRVPPAPPYNLSPVVNRMSLGEPTVRRAEVLHPVGRLP